MDDHPKPPLWRVMHETAARAFTGDLNHPHAERIITAAEIRALADWLVPEEVEPYLNPAYGPGFAENPAWDRWHARRQLRQILLAEADRAEAGE